MAMGAQSPERLARSRYSANFKSTIFEPLPTPQGQAYVPAGKRRDQTTSELFGSYDDKDLRGMPKTFVPKEDGRTARQKKQNFLYSEVLPASSHQQPPYTGRSDREAGTGRSAQQANDDDDEDHVDPNMRRQVELRSQVFDRPAREVNARTLHDRSLRLTPNDYTWHSHPEQPLQEDSRTHGDRAFEEKCSGLFDHRERLAPPSRAGYLQEKSEARQADLEGDAKRRSNAYYSDLFGRGSAATAQQVDTARRHKHQGTDEDKLTVHQDWTDCKTELLSRGSRPEHPALRKSDELHQARIFGPRTDAWAASTDRPPAVTYDNSAKVAEAVGLHPRQVHQAHLRTSMESDGFYDNAERHKDWEVVELHISGLGQSADDDFVRDLCQGFDLQLVKVSAEVDPVRNLCKGRAKVMVRYNPTRESIRGLVDKLEERSLRVEL